MTTKAKRAPNKYPSQTFHPTFREYRLLLLFHFPDFNPLFPIGKFHVFMGANVRYFMENMYNIPNNYKMQQIIFSNKILLFISFLSGLLTVCIYTFFNS